MTELFDTEIAETTKENVPQDKVKSIIEALLFVSKRPMSVREIKRVLDDDVNMKELEILGLVEELKIDYIKQQKCFRIVEIAGGFQIRTQPEYAGYIMRLFKYDQTERLSGAALETLAIIAYRQPITKADIEGIRGVDVSGVVRVLYDKGLLKILGRKEVPGRPIIYGTTQLFLEHFGLNGLDDLPKSAELRRQTETQIKLKL